MELIRPSSDLRNHYNEIAKSCRENRQPVYLTVNGRGDTVLMGIAQYEQMKAELELLQMLAESEEDERMGRVTSSQEVFDDIRRMLAEKKQ